MSMCVYINVISWLNGCIDLHVSRRERKRKKQLVVSSPGSAVGLQAHGSDELIQVWAQRIRSFRCCLALDGAYLRGVFVTY